VAFTDNRLDKETVQDLKTVQELKTTKNKKTQNTPKQTTLVQLPLAALDAFLWTFPCVFMHFSCIFVKNRNAFLWSVNALS